MDFTIVTACTPDYMKKLMWTMPTWKTKSQFADKKLMIFYKDLSQMHINTIKKYWSNSELIEWSMPEYDGQRELMLSSFVLGAAKYVKTQYYVKLDADAYFTNDKDVFAPEDFQYDLFAHRWGYTKPGWWVNKMDAWTNNDSWDGDMSNKGSVGHKRIISWCCLHNMDFVRKAARIAGDRLPIPSHDSYLWYLADRFDDVKWKSSNLKKRGVDHNGRWRSIREHVCANDSAWNEYLNECLLRHVQLEITTACNMQCHNCDRNCGTARSGEYMTIEQIRKFVDESLELEHIWDRIDILGGEPSMHPNLSKVIDEIKRYKDIYPRCTIRFTTNGHGDRANQVLTTLPAWIDIRNSAKENKNQLFDAYNLAPIDNGHKRAKSCSIPWRCGLGLTRYGYFLCGAGASVARVFGLDIGIKNLKDINIKKLKRHKKYLCKYCGHSLSDKKQVDQQMTSLSWAKAFTDYQNYDLDLY